MRSGVSIASIADQAVWSIVTGAADAANPVTNLSDLFNTNRIASINPATGYVQLRFDLPAPAMMQFLGIIFADTPVIVPTSYRIRLWSDVGTTVLVYDTGAGAGVGTALWSTGNGPVLGYRAIKPHVATSPILVAAGVIEFWSLPADLLLSGVEISGWWEWKDVAVPRSLGFKVNDAVVNQPFGVDHVMSQWNPRTISGTRELTDQAENLTTAVDFQLEKKTSRPFVWVQDIDDPTTFPREVVLVRNSKITPPHMLDYPGGKQSFDFVEHLR